MNDIDIPPEIVAELQPGDTLIPVPTDEGIEYWILDEEGELVDICWMAKKQRSLIQKLGMVVTMIFLIVVVGVWAV